MNHYNWSKDDLVSSKAIGAVIYNPERDKILMLFNNKLNMWSIPAGKVEKGELSAMALIREIKEECDIDIKEYEMMLSFSKSYYRKGKVVPIYCAVFEVQKYIGDVRNVEKGKHGCMKFFSVDHIRKFKRLTDMTIQTIKHFDERMAE